MKASRAQLLCSIAWLLGACGTAAPYDYERPATTWPALTTVIADITGGPHGAKTSDIKAALVWFPVSPAKGKIQFSQPVSSSWLAPFKMEIVIAQTPPEPAIGGGADPNMRYGQAELLLYEDRTGNDNLDLVPLGALGSEDRVLGRAMGVRFWWLAEGAPAKPTSLGYEPVAPRLSVTTGPETVDPEPSDCFDPDMPRSGQRCSSRIPKTPPKELAASDAIPVELTGSPALQSYTCMGFWGTSPQKSDEWPDYTPGWKSTALKKKLCDGGGCECRAKADLANVRPSADCPLDLPNPGQELVKALECNDENTAYVWKSCVRDPELCETYFCHYGHGELIPGEPVPANWPCDTKK